MFNSQIAALPYNPYFEEEIKKVRKKYGIPGDSTKAKDWFKKLLLKYKKSTFVFLFNLISGRYFPYHLAVFELDLEEDFKHVLAEGAGEMQTIKETEVLVTEENLRDLEQLNTQWVDHAITRTPFPVSGKELGPPQTGGGQSGVAPGTAIPPSRFRRDQPIHQAWGCGALLQQAWNGRAVD